MQQYQAYPPPVVDTQPQDKPLSIALREINSSLLTSPRFSGPLAQGALAERGEDHHRATRWPAIRSAAAIPSSFGILTFRPVTT